MTSEFDNPYVFTANGAVNGKPYSLEFDVKQWIAGSMERRGEILSDEQLETQSLQVLHDLQRVQELEQLPRPEPNRLQRIAARLGSFISR